LQERDEFECTVLEVKVIEGLGTTIDVTLVNGILKVQDTIVVQGLNGPIVTQIRALLTPQPMKEMRVKGEYVHHQKIKGAMGIKISAPGLEQAIAGAELIKANGQEEIDAAWQFIYDDK
jgi:translation initiation factor 5B